MVEVCPLLIICHKLGLPCLQSHILQCLDSLLTTDNACKVINLAHQSISLNHTEEYLVHSMWTVINICLQFAVKHNSDILSSDAFLELSQEVMIVLVSAKVRPYTIIVLVINKNIHNIKLRVSTEEILKALLRWARYKVGTSKLLQSDWTEDEREHVREYIDEVVKHIHVADGRLSPDTISDGIYGMLER